MRAGDRITVPRRAPDVYYLVGTVILPETMSALYASSFRDQRTHTTLIRRVREVGFAFSRGRARAGLRIGPSVGFAHNPTGPTLLDTTGKDVPWPREAALR